MRQPSRKSSRIGWVIGLAMLVAPLFPACAQAPDHASIEFRNQFLQRFDRTGMDTTPSDAMMLRILVEARHAQRGVEVGSFHGFGAINMGIGFERTGGHLYTLEIDPDRAQRVRQNLRTVRLEKTVTCITGDARKTLAKLTGKFDFVFLDAAKDQYFDYLKLIEPKLVPGAVIVADNVIRLAAPMRNFLDYIENNPNYETVIIRASMEKHDGMLVGYKIR